MVRKSWKFKRLQKLCNYNLEYMMIGQEESGKSKDFQIVWQGNSGKVNGFHDFGKWKSEKSMDFRKFAKRNLEKFEGLGSWSRKI